MTMTKTEKVIERAKITLSVISQLPMLSDPEAKAAGNLVYKYCKMAACETKEEEEAWDEVFANALPM